MSKLSTKHVEATDSLDENQLGCRPNCSADNVALIDEFIIEVHRLTFRNLFELQNDAKACFDRILDSHAMLHSRKFEVPDKICKIYSTILRNTKWRVHTTLGTFQNHYEHSTTTPIHGTGQGLKLSGTHWIFISVPMMRTLERKTTVV